MSQTDRQSAQAEDGPPPDGAAPSPSVTTSAVAPRPRRRFRRGLISLLIVLLLLFSGGFALLGVSGSFLRLPVWVVAEAEARLNQTLAPAMPDAALSLGGVEVGVDSDWIPRLRIEDLRLLHRDGSPILILPEARLAFSLSALKQGQLRPSSLRLSGGRIDLIRERDGSLNLAFEGGQGASRIDSLTALFASIDAALALPGLSHLSRIEADALTMTLTDRRSGRIWDLGDGRLRLENRTDELRAEMGFSLLDTQGTPAQAQMTAITRKGESTARLSATVDRVKAGDLAALIPPLAPLAAVEGGAISGKLGAALAADGITAMDAVLELGSGALRPTPASVPVPFDRASMTLAYDAARGRVNLTALGVESNTLRLKASGHSYLVDGEGAILTGPLGARLPAAFLSQISISQMQVDPAGLFQQPVRFSQGALDLRIHLDPFQIDIGQVALVEADRRLSARGTISAGRDGWTASVDLALDSISHTDLLALWPVKLVVRTREWLAQNVLEGTLSDVKAALRIAPGKEPVLSLGYDFRAADVRFLRTLPPIRAADGYATIEGMTYTMVVSRGSITPPKGGVIDMAGSVFSVLDITRRPAQAEVMLRTASSLTAALSLLDEPPFGFLAKAGRPVDLGQGQARIEATLRFPLVPRLQAQDVVFSVFGTVTDFASDRLVPNKVVTAPDLSLSADPRGLRVSGAGRIGAVPFDVTFTQPFGKEAGPARVEGTVALSRDTITEFGLGLPEVLARGDGQGMVTIDLPKGEPARLRLVSDLNRIAMDLPGTGWRKPAAATGRLEVDATLGQQPLIDSLVIEAPGLSARGRVTLRPDGGLDAADFPDVALGGWMTGAVRVAGRGEGRPVAITVTGGNVDIRRKPPAGNADGGGADGMADIPLTLSLDRLRITESISLTRFRGEFSPRGGFNGTFSSLVNGQAAITGTVVPGRNGPAFRIRSDNAGGVLASAGVFASARGGQLDLSLVPRPQDGVYDGRADIRDFRVIDAPVLAELLNAVSVVGLLEQLNGSGLAFSQALGEFILTPEAVEISRGSAVGNSIGVSMAGVYGTETGALDLQGVVSPVYMLNGIGSVLTRRGEGLFGFNYRVRGTKDRSLVSVNPLSILTPGMFRDLFRRDPPSLAEPKG